MIDFDICLIDEGLRSEKASMMIEEAVAFGLLEWVLFTDDEKDIDEYGPALLLRKGPAMTSRSQLAYFCKCASTYLDMDKGAMQESDKNRTAWSHFESTFGREGKHLRQVFQAACDAIAPDPYKDEKIDMFFAHLATMQPETREGQDGDRFEEHADAAAFGGDKAARMFNAAIDEGLLRWVVINAPEVDFCSASSIYALRPCGAIRTKSQLAYFCVRASAYLELPGSDSGRTCWAPFEQLFNDGGATLRNAVGKVFDTKAPERYIRAIDLFFDNLSK